MAGNKRSQSIIVKPEYLYRHPCVHHQRYGQVRPLRDCLSVPQLTVPWEMMHLLVVVRGELSLDCLRRRVVRTISQPSLFLVCCKNCNFGNILLVHSSRDLSFRDGFHSFEYFEEEDEEDKEVLEALEEGELEDEEKSNILAMKVVLFLKYVFMSAK